MATTFFLRLGKALAARGHVVRRINFNGGDRLLWALPGAVDYRGDHTGWPDFLADRLADWRISDIVLFGDCRPLHREALRVAREHGVQVHVFEEGYLRPNWVTLELGGVNGHSALRNDPAWYLDQAADTPPWTGGDAVHNSFVRRSIEDIIYNVGSSLLAHRYPGYRTHRPWSWTTEYASWFKRIGRTPASKRRLAVQLRRLLTPGTSYFVFPLQLDSDSQIRVHSSFGRMAPAIATVISSFAKHAPPSALLVIKEHPLDNAMTDWRRLVRAEAGRNGIADRVIYVAGGKLEELIATAAGVVTINSTVGILALSFGRPLIALGKAIYNVPQLTYPGSLDEFWQNPTPPNVATFDAFRRVVAARTQLNGGFFSDSGLKLAVAAAVERLEALCVQSPIDDMVARRPERARVSGRPAGWTPYSPPDTDFAKS
jgi:capsular polysaccharide export protein